MSNLAANHRFFSAGPASSFRCVPVGQPVNRPFTTTYCRMSWRERGFMWTMHKALTCSSHRPESSCAIDVVQHTFPAHPAVRHSLLPSFFFLLLLLHLATQRQNRDRTGGHGESAVFASNLVAGGLGRPDARGDRVHESLQSFPPRSKCLCTLPRYFCLSALVISPGCGLIAERSSLRAHTNRVAYTRHAEGSGRWAYNCTMTLLAF